MKKFASREGWWSWIPLVTGFLAASIFILLTGPTAVNFADAGDYIAAARSLIAGEGYPREATLPFFRPPLYPLFIASIWMLVPQSVVAVKVAQAAIFGLTALVFFHLGITIFKNRSVALIGGLLYAINPFFLSMVSDIQTEPLHTLLFALGMYAVTQSVIDQESRFRNAILGGFAFGLAALCRPSALLIGFGVIVAMLFVARHRGSYNNVWRLSGAALAALTLTIMPWTFANWRATGEVIIITDGAGYTAWVGNHPESIRTYTGTFKRPSDLMYFNSTYLQDILVRRKIREWERNGGYRALSLKQREARWRQGTLANMRKYPGLTLKLWGHKLWGYWRPWLYPAAYGSKTVLASAVICISLYALALYGALASWKNQNARLFIKLVVVMFLVSTAAHVTTLSMIRYRLPYVDPYLCILAGYALWFLSQRARPRRNAELIFP